MEALAALEASAPAAALRASRWGYAAVSALHVAGVGLLFGAVAALDLRLIGCWRSAPLAALGRVLVPVAAAGLALAALAGAALFAVRAREYAANPAFLAKLALVALGALNALALGRPALRDGRRAALAGALSLLVWAGAILAGRLIAFV